MYNKYDSIITLKSQYDFALELKGTFSKQDSINIQNEIRKYNEAMQSHSYNFLKNGELKAVYPGKGKEGFKEKSRNGKYHVKNNVVSIEMAGKIVEFYYEIDEYMTLKQLKILMEVRKFSLLMPKRNKSYAKIPA